MNKSFFSKKTPEAIIKDKTLRTTAILITLLLIASAGLTYTNASFSKKIEANQKQIEDSKMQLIELQNIASNEEGPIDEKVINRSFAPYSEIVPFISLLESLFAIIDPDSKINVRNNEKGISINRYADYEVVLKPIGKMELFLKALDELHKSKYLTKIVNFNMNYAPKDAGGRNELSDVNLTIRLYFE